MENKEQGRWVEFSGEKDLEVHIATYPTTHPYCGFFKRNGKFGFAPSSDDHRSGEVVYHNLYILTDEPYSKGDVIMFDELLGVWDGEALVTDDSITYLKRRSLAKKVVGSTNKSFHTYQTIPDEFIRAFVACNGFNKALMTFYKVVPQTNGTRTDGKVFDEISLSPEHNTLLVPKPDSNNQLILKPFTDVH